MQRHYRGHMAQQCKGFEPNPIEEEQGNREPFKRGHTPKRAQTKTGRNQDTPKNPTLPKVHPIKREGGFPHIRGGGERERSGFAHRIFSHKIGQVTWTCPTPSAHHVDINPPPLSKSLESGAAIFAQTIRSGFASEQMRAISQMQTLTTWC